MKRPALLGKEDYWAIWLGGLLLLIGMWAFWGNAPTEGPAKQTVDIQAPFTTIEQYEGQSADKKALSQRSFFAKFLKNLTGKPGGWTNDPISSFIVTSQEAANIRSTAQAKENLLSDNIQSTFQKAKLAENLARAENFANPTLNKAAENAIQSWQAAINAFEKNAQKTNTQASNKIPYLLGLLVLLLMLFGLSAYFLDIPFPGFITGFAAVFGLGIVAYWVAGQADLKAMGLGYALWAIIFGLTISNTLGIPKWLKPALQTPLYIKTGLVLLGAEILMSKIFAIGIPGLFVAWVVTPVVLITTYWFGQKILKIPSKSLNMTISADMSVCGVSAAVATAAACKATKEELTLSIGLSMVFTSVMMVVLPLFINWLGLPEVLGGAWIGGTIDATGAVVAAGAFLGDTALSVAATIKMIQNVLIGVIAFGVAIYFATRGEDGEPVKVGIDEIWRRFPKFILGFIGASIIFSILYQSFSPNVAQAYIDNGVNGSFSKNIRGWLFCLAFVSIGLSTNFKALQSHFSGGKPLILYACGQTLNLALTLLMAYIMFYLVFPEITSQI